jgi:hypothetical protein
VITISVSVTETRCGFAGSKDDYHTHSISTTASTCSGQY